MYAGGSRTSSSVSSGRAARDVLWERALSALPPELLSALRAAELDDPRVLSEYPVESLHDLEEYVGGKVEIGGAPSGAASSAHSPLSSSHSCSLQTGPSGSGSSGTADVPVTGRGGDPRTDHFPLAGAHEGGGDPRTDHALSDGIARFLVGVSPHSGGLATQTATPSPACTDPGISADFSRDSEVRDGCPSSAVVSELPDGLSIISHDPHHRDAFPSSAEVPVLPDGLSTISQVPNRCDAFPSSAEGSDRPDGFPRAGVMEYSKYSDSVFSRDFYTVENSERLRESDSGVQNFPLVAAHPS